MKREALEHLVPKEHRRVMDLVEEVGHDISDWANYAKGQVEAAANPKYCYEWAFYQPGQPVILNLWYSEMKVSDEGVVYQSHNMRRLSSELSTIKGKKHVSKRAYNFDEALKKARAEKLPVRVVVCEGSRSDVLNSDPASKVERRYLDPGEWWVTTYDMMTGEAVITRGVSRRYVDQHSLSEGQDGPARSSSRSIEYARQRKVRDAALERSGGLCEYCKHPGFVTLGGYRYLETHHIVPLSEGGRDAIDNVVALCPTDHRIAHYGENHEMVQQELMAIVRGLIATSD